MKIKNVFIGLLCLLVLAASAQVASAYQVTILNNYGIWQTGRGGEFGVKPIDFNPLGLYSNLTKNQGSTPSFQTFCIETNEFIDDNVTYNAVFNTAAVAGGTGGGSPDQISKGTAWLYYNFAKGTLSGSYAYEYNNSSGARKSDADLLQKAIWYLEDEYLPDTTTLPDVSTNKFYLAAVAFWGSSASAKDDAGGLYGVRAMNLSNSPNYKQDLLVVTPIPTAVWLLGTGLIGFIGFKRRMRKE